VCTHLCYVDMCGGATLALHVLITRSHGMFCPPSPRLNCLCAPRNIHVAESPRDWVGGMGGWDGGGLGDRPGVGPRSFSRFNVNVTCQPVRVCACPGSALNLFFTKSYQFSHFSYQNSPFFGKKRRFEGREDTYVATLVIHSENERKVWVRTIVEPQITVFDRTNIQ